MDSSAPPPLPLIVQGGTALLVYAGALLLLARIGLLGRTGVGDQPFSERLPCFPTQRLRPCDGDPSPSSDQVRLPAGGEAVDQGTCSREPAGSLPLDGARTPGR